jgi:hypothetical protein
LREWVVRASGHGVFVKKYLIFEELGGGKMVRIDAGFKQLSKIWCIWREIFFYGQTVAEDLVRMARIFLCR